MFAKFPSNRRGSGRIGKLAAGLWNYNDNATMIGCTDSIRRSICSAVQYARRKANIEHGGTHTQDCRASPPRVQPFDSGSVQPLVRCKLTYFTTNQFCDQFVVLQVHLGLFVASWKLEWPRVCPCSVLDLTPISCCRLLIGSALGPTFARVAQPKRRGRQTLRELHTDPFNCFDSRRYFPFCAMSPIMRSSSTPTGRLSQVH